jgi:Protein of unknown function (DUF1523)
MSGYWFWGGLALVILIAAVAVHIWLPPGSRGRRIVKWSVWGTLALIVGAFLHYTMPQHDIVRIVGTYVERQDLNDWTRIFWATPDDQSATLINRDVQFVQAVTVDGTNMVYRNEDTGWGWPPYFKFDTASLQTAAADAASNKGAPEWYSVTHYGWRIKVLSVFPNAMAIRPVAGPDVTIIPWVNIIILLVLAVILFMIRRMWLQFRERTIDPMVTDAEDVIEGIDARADAARAEIRTFWGRLMAWFGTWRKKPRS